MPRLIAILLALLIAGAAGAEDQLDRPAPLERLRPAETRFLQALMAVEGTYDGQIDGAWSGRSLDGLEELAGQELGTESLSVRDLATLAAPFRQILATGRWEPFHDSAADISFLLPMAVVARQPGDSEIAFLSGDGHLLVRTRVGSGEEAKALHEWVEANSLSPDSITRVVRPDRIITSSVLNDALNSVHVYSQEVGQQQVATTLVQWRPQRAAEARLIAASIARGSQRALELPDGGIVNRAILAVQDNPAASPGQPEPQENQIRESGEFAGTAFYINNTDLVTASALLRACNGLKLEDGTALVPVEDGRGLGAAVLTSPHRSRHWLTLPDGEVPPAGAALTVVGYPFLGRDYRGLGTTEGRMDGRATGESGGQRLAFAMARRAGNLGAPVIDDTNTVVGIVVGRAEGDREPLPERVTLGAPIGAFANFLTRNDILHDTRVIAQESSQQTFVRSRAARAIVPVFCR